MCCLQTSIVASKPGGGGQDGQKNTKNDPWLFLIAWTKWIVLVIFRSKEDAVIRALNAQIAEQKPNWILNVKHPSLTSHKLSNVMF